MKSRVLGVLVAFVGLIGLLTACEPEDIVASDQTYGSIGGYNGYRVYLSSPTHSDSGFRGECRNPGWEENVNGRAWNYYAALGEYHNDVYNPNSPYRNIRTRGYQVVVSGNPRNNDYIGNRTRSNNWGADLHIVSHTNASKPCPDGTQYTLGMWRAHDVTYGKALAVRLTTVVGNVAPGPTRNWCAGSDPACGSGGLAELSAQAPRKAYMELIFHTNQASQTWFKGTGNADRGSQRYAWRYGAAIDNELGYP